MGCRTKHSHIVAELTGHVGVGAPGRFCSCRATAEAPPRRARVDRVVDAKACAADTVAAFALRSWSFPSGWHALLSRAQGQGFARHATAEEVRCTHAETTTGCAIILTVFHVHYYCFPRARRRRKRKCLRNNKKVCCKLHLSPN